MKEIIKTSLKNHKEALDFVCANGQIIEDIANACIESMRNGGKVFFMGNGGSAADAQHLAAELIGRFKKNRRALPSIALTTNTSSITAIGNDFGYDQTFVRELSALANINDVVIGLSTSGNSDNVIKAMEKARSIGARTIGFLGKDGGKLKDMVDIAFIVPTEDTPRIQEMHGLVGHIVCEIIENSLT